MVTATWSRRRRTITAANSGLGSVAPILLVEASATQEDPRRPGHCRVVDGTRRRWDDPPRPAGRRASSTWILMFPRLDASRPPKDSRLEAAVPVPMSTRLGAGGPWIAAPGPAARTAATACVSAPPIDRQRLPGGADPTGESGLADGEVPAQRCEVHVIVLGNGGPGRWRWHSSPCLRGIGMIDPTY